MAYHIEIRPAAYRELGALPKGLRERITPKIDLLADNPYPPRTNKLAGAGKRYRVRISEYRVVYDVHRDVLLILVIRMGHKREVYR